MFSSPSRPYLYLISVAAIWGIAPPVIKHVLAFLPVDIFLVYRYLITISFMTPFLLLSEPRSVHILVSLNSKDWLVLFLAGLLGSVFQLGFLFWGLSLTSAVDGAIINATSPVFVTLGGYLVLREHIARRQIIGLIVAFIGTLSIVLEPVITGNHSDSGTFTGNFLVLLGTISWTAYVLLTKKYLNHKISALLLTTVMFWIGTAVMTLLVLYRYPLPGLISGLAAIPLSAWIGIVYMALISGGLAYWLYQQAQRHIAASKADVFLYLSPIFTLPISYFWLGESITLLVIIGCLIITTGVAVAEVSRHRSHHLV